MTSTSSSSSTYAPIVIGVDIGGANIKYATNSGRSFDRFFPMWRHPDQLKDSLQQDLKNLASYPMREASLAITMTGELADCFVDRAEGVRHIVDHTENAAAALGIKDIQYYGVDSQFHTATKAVELTDRIAAANWHCLASFIGDAVAADGLAIDIGSTTTDIIPIRNGQVATTAQTDFDRLQEGSLIYVGCRRTPVCSLLNSVTHNGSSISVMNENFATIDDARILLSMQPELPDDLDTCDGKPRTIPYSVNRLARMIGLDRRTISVPQANAIAQQIIAEATNRIAAAIPQSTHGATIISGHGDDLLQIVGRPNVIRLKDTLNDGLARCAPAYAVCRLLHKSLANTTKMDLGRA